MKFFFDVETRRPDSRPTVSGGLLISQKTRLSIGFYYYRKGPDATALVLDDSLQSCAVAI